MHTDRARFQATEEVLIPSTGVLDRAGALHACTSRMIGPPLVLCQPELLTGVSGLVINHMSFLRDSYYDDDDENSDFTHSCVRLRVSISM